MSQFTPTAAVLNEFPETLLRNRNPHIALCVNDSKVAAVIAQGSYFVTSPNAEVIPAPPSGATRSLHLRQDGLWGDDDPIQWPQIFTPTFCHFSAIPISGAANSERMLWFHPTREHFVCPASGRSILRGCGKLSVSTLCGLGDVFERVHTKYRAFLDSTSSDKIPTLLPPLMQTAVLAVSRLRTLPAGYMEVVLTVRALQRSLLEAIAIMDFKLVYQPRMVGATRTHLPVEVEPRMGTFTADLRTVEDHLVAGLPVWFIQPSSAFRFQNILGITPLLLPQETLEMTLLEPTAPPVFVGGHTGKIECIQYLSRKIGYTSDPFNNPTPVASPIQTSIGPIRNHTCSSYELSAPYPNQRKRIQLFKPKIQSSGRDKFKPVDSPYMPDYIPSWKSALASVNTHRPTHPRSIDDSNYLFPDIAIFCTANSVDCKARYFTMWKHLRGALIHRVFSGAVASQFPAVPLRPQEWRDILNGDMFKQGPEQPRRPTRNQANILNLEKLLAPCLANVGVSLDLGNGPVGMALPSADEARAILWEISELNFRLEFIALDKRAHGLPAADSRETLIYRCFPGWTPAGFSPLQCDLRHADQGLAAAEWRAKLPFLLQLNIVMESWVGYPANQISVLSQNDYDQMAVLDLEFRLGRFYTQSFFEYFGRAACIPMALYAK
ncbi:hypothetical protein C8R46DRAFT_1212479 [Mycena filopes]|nr:hypothetical protein C8R46DRAFT_1212474 [Mycena filopes]KAJ7177743.1 hypothetical protein C8R46DRAFT_1212479 [Mycena filopes]